MLRIAPSLTPAILSRSLAVIIAYDADQKAVVEFISDGPLCMEFVPRLILGRID